MNKRIVRNIYSDSLIVSKSPFVRGALLGALLLMAWTLYLGSQTYSYDGNVSAYYTYQMLLSSVHLLLFFPIIVSAFLGSRDCEWQTDGYRLATTTRGILFLSRVSYILLMSFVMILTNLAFGLLFDMIANDFAPLNAIWLGRLFVPLFLVFFWSITAYSIAFLSRSFALSFCLSFGYFFLEIYLEKDLPESVLAWLPVWNQWSLMKHFFTENGVIGLVQRSFGHPLRAYAVLSVLLMVFVGTAYYVSRRREY